MSHPHRISERSRVIRRSTYLLVGITASVLLGPASLFVVQGRRFEQSEARIREYHTATIGHSDAIREAISRLHLAVLRDPVASLLRIARRDALAIIGQKLARIRRLQDRFGGPESSQSVTRAEAQLAALAGRSLLASGADELPEKELVALAATALQIDRLHAIAARRELAGLAAARSLGVRVLALAALFSVVFGAILGARIV